MRLQAPRYSIEELWFTPVDSFTDLQFKLDHSFLVFDSNLPRLVPLLFWCWQHSRGLRPSSRRVLVPAEIRGSQAMRRPSNILTGDGGGQWRGCVCVNTSSTNTHMCKWTPPSPTFSPQHAHPNTQRDLWPYSPLHLNSCYNTFLWSLSHILYESMGEKKLQKVEAEP